jgi:hypothetical protein
VLGDVRGNDVQTPRPVLISGRPIQPATTADWGPIMGPSQWLKDLQNVNHARCMIDTIDDPVLLTLNNEATLEAAA